MPGTRDAEFLVARTRDLLQQFDQTPFRDGFPDDDPAAVAAGATPILAWINKAVEDLYDTQYRQCRYIYGLNAGQTEYTLDPNIHEITHVELFGQPIKRSSLLGLDTRWPGWANTSANVPTDGPPNIYSPTQPGLPSLYYTNANLLGFYPQPDMPYEVVILATSITPDLVEREDVPVGLPSRYHMALAFGAASYLCTMDAEDEASGKKQGQFQKKFMDLHDELQGVISARGWDTDEQIAPMDYRYYTRRGGDG